MHLSDANDVRGVLDAAAEIMQTRACRRGSCDWLGESGQVLVTGDLHDNPFHFQKIVGLADLKRSEERHLILHEVIHGDRLVGGVDLSYRMLVRVAALVVAHPKQVHPMLANHELAQLTRRRISKGQGNSVELFEAGVDWAFNEKSDAVLASIGEFIKAMAMAVRSEGGLFASHSLPPAAMMEAFDESVFERAMTSADRQGSDCPAYLMTWGRQHTQEQVDALREAWGVQLFCLGHVAVPDGINRPLEGVLVLNSDHDGGAVLSIDLADIPAADDALGMAIRLSAIPLEVEDG